MIKMNPEYLNKPATAVALGTDGFCVGRSQELAESLLETYLAAGGNVLDTARMYGRPDVGEYGICEAFTGRWIEKNADRSKLVLSTKGGFPAVDGRPRVDRESLMGDMHESLDALRTDFIDVYWLHRDDPASGVEPIMEAVNALLETGNVGIVGASNWSAKRIREANAYAAAHGMRGFLGNQPQWSLAWQAVNPDPTLQIMDSEAYLLHAETNMLCMPFSAQAKGYFAKLLSGGEAALSPKAKQRFHVPENIEIAEKLRILSAEKGVNPAALSVAWLTNQPFPTIPVISAGSAAQLQETLEAGNIALTAEEVQHLRKMA